MGTESDEISSLPATKREGNSAMTQQLIADLTTDNARKLCDIRLGENETNEGGARPASYYNN
jgi:hypothetical protein